MSQSIFRKFGFSLTRMILSAGAGLAVSIIVARSLGASAMGIYSFMVWVAATISALSLAGLPDSISKFVAHYKGLGDHAIAGRIARIILGGQIATALIATVVCGVAWLLIDRSRADLVLLAMATVLPASLQQTSLALLEGEQRFDLQVAATLGGSLGQLAIMVVIAVVRPTIGGFLFGNVLSAFVVLGTTLFVCRGTVLLPKSPTPITPGKIAVREILSFSAPVYCLGILNLIVFDKSEFAFLRHWAGAEEIAFYGIAFGLAARLATMGDSLVYVLFPLFVTTHAQSGKDELLTTYRQSIRMVEIAIFPLCAWAIPMISRVVLLAYGGQFVKVTPILQVLLISTVFSVVMSISSSVLYALDRQKAILVWMIPVAGMNIALDCVLIPRFAGIGAAVANGISQGLACAGLLVLLRRVMPESFPVRFSLGVGTASIISALPIFGVAQWGGPSAIPILLSMLAAPIIYVLLLKGGRVLAVEEEDALSRVWDSLLRKGN